MLFREITENKEVRDETASVNDNWKKIKPKKEYTPKEIDLFWQEEFVKIARETKEL